jgi:hypothetical protein
MKDNTALRTGALRLTAAVLLTTVLLHTTNTTAAPRKVSAGELLLRIPVPAVLAARLGGLSGTELLEISAGNGNEGPKARVIQAFELPVGSRCVLTGIVGAVNTATGTLQLGDYTVDYTPLLHDTAFAVPATGSVATLTARDGCDGSGREEQRFVAAYLLTRPSDSATLTLAGITGSARSGITGSAGPTLTGITGSARSGITGSAGPTLTGITGSARSGITGSARPSATKAGITGSARGG